LKHHWWWLISQFHPRNWLWLLSDGLFSIAQQNDQLYATEQFYRVFMVLFAPAYVLFLPFIFTAATTWSARNYSPRRLWRPLTMLSLVAATISSSCVLVLQAIRSINGELGQLVSAWAMSYLVFCAVLLPHSIARFRVLQRAKAARKAMRQPQV
jgi:hypothetical protein